MAPNMQTPQADSGATAHSLHSAPPLATLSTRYPPERSPPHGPGDTTPLVADETIGRQAPTIGEIRHHQRALLRICRTVRRSTSPPPAFWPGLASKIGPTSPIFRATDRSRLSGGRRAPNASQIWCGRFRRRGSFRWLSQRARCLPQPHEQHRDPKGRHPSRFSLCSAHGPHAACCGA